jgi:hypothetical protein
MGRLCRLIIVYSVVFGALPRAVAQTPVLWTGKPTTKLCPVGLIENVDKSNPTVDREISRTAVEFVNVSLGRKDRGWLVSPFPQSVLSDKQLGWRIRGQHPSAVMIVGLRIKQIGGLLRFGSDYNKFTVDAGGRGLTCVGHDQISGDRAADPGAVRVDFYVDPRALILTHLATDGIGAVLCSLSLHLSNCELSESLGSFPRGVSILRLALAEKFPGLIPHLPNLEHRDGGVNQSCEESAPRSAAYGLLGAVLAIIFSLRVSYRCIIGPDYGPHVYRIVRPEFLLFLAFLAGTYGSFVVLRHVVNIVEPLADSSNVFLHSMQESDDFGRQLHTKYKNRVNHEVKMQEDWQ